MVGQLGIHTVCVIKTQVGSKVILGLLCKLHGPGLEVRMKVTFSEAGKQFPVLHILLVLYFIMPCSTL